MAWYNVFTRIFGLLKKAFKLAQDAGLTDEVVDLALKWVKVAASRAMDSPTKREWVVRTLVEKGVKEAIARIAVELAYGLFKDELKKLDEI